MLAGHPILTWLIIATTVAVTVAAFRRPQVEQALIFDPWEVLAGKQYHRVLTSGFLHADYPHLALNMISLYLFGPGVEAQSGGGSYLAVYLGAITGGSLLSLYLHRHHEYRAYGASGGVCGVIFAHVLLFPGARVMVWPMPVFIPAWLYVLLFMVGSFYAMRRGRDNVGHDAHLGGAMVGLGLAAVMNPTQALENWKILSLVLLLSAGLLVVVLRNPLALARAPFFAARSSLPRPDRPRRGSRGERQQVDALLDKISREGMQSLTPSERTFLEGVSGKYQRREQSEKPKSDLAI